MRHLVEVAVTFAKPLLWWSAAAIASTVGQMAAPEASPLWQLTGFGSVILTVLYIMRRQRDDAAAEIAKEREFWREFVRRREGAADAPAPGEKPTDETKRRIG